MLYILIGVCLYKYSIHQNSSNSTHRSLNVAECKVLFCFAFLNKKVRDWERGTTQVPGLYWWQHVEGVIPSSRRGLHGVTGTRT
jgi:hypothetical protein